MSKTSNTFPGHQLTCLPSLDTISVDCDTHMDFETLSNLTKLNSLALFYSGVADHVPIDTCLSVFEPLHALTKLLFEGDFPNNEQLAQILRM